MTCVRGRHHSVDRCVSLCKPELNDAVGCGAAATQLRGVNRYARAVCGKRCIPMSKPSYFLTRLLSLTAPSYFLASVRLSKPICLYIWVGWLRWCWSGRNPSYGIRMGHSTINSGAIDGAGYVPYSTQGDWALSICIRCKGPQNALNCSLKSTLNRLLTTTERCNGALKCI